MKIDTVSRSPNSSPTKLDPIQRETSCEQCRKAHRKCGREKPECGNCVRKKRKCTYVDPSRNKMIKFTDVTSNFIPSFREDELARKSSAYSHVNISYDAMAYYVPVIEGTRARGIMEYIRDLAFEYSCATPRPSQGELALVFAIQASSFMRTGQKKIAMALYSSCRQTLLPVFYNMQFDFEVAACHACLSQYLLGLGDIKGSKYHLSNAQLYFEKVGRELNDRETALYLSTSFYAAQLDVSGDLSSKLQQMHRMVVILGGASEDQIDYDNTEQLDQVLRYIFRRLEGLKNAPPATIEAKKVYMAAIIQGSKIQKYKSRNMPLEMMVPIADSITRLISNDCFKLCHGLITVAVMEATEVHMKMMHQEPSQELMHKLQEDLRGLNIMKERHDVVRAMYEKAIQNVSDFVTFNQRVFGSVGDLGITPSTGGFVIFEDFI